MSGCQDLEKLCGVKHNGVQRTVLDGGSPGAEDILKF